MPATRFDKVLKQVKELTPRERKRLRAWLDESLASKQANDDATDETEQRAWAALSKKALKKIFPSTAAV